MRWRHVEHLDQDESEVPCLRLRSPSPLSSASASRRRLQHAHQSPRLQHAHQSPQPTTPTNYALSATPSSQTPASRTWSTRRAKEISLGLGTSFASFGGGVGLLTGEGKSQSILNYVMTFIMCAIKTSSPCGDSIDAIPFVPCECCGKDMPLCWTSGDFATQPWSWRVLDLCDDCELVHQGM